MAYIYKIVNDVNDKIYIGKTEFSIHKRFKEHCRDAYKIRNEKRPLYNAMKLYGIEHFNVELIEECSQQDSLSRKQYWIEYFQSYEYGYNATKGGDGSYKFNHQEIVDELRKNPYPKEVAEKIKCSVDLVYKIAKANNIKVFNRGGIENVNPKKTIHQLDKKTGKYLQTFESVQKAMEWCVENKYCAALSSGARGHISACANGKRKSAYGFKWSYIK